jgi:hypothetical protein
MKYLYLILFLFPLGCSKLEEMEKSENSKRYTVYSNGLVFSNLTYNIFSEHYYDVNSNRLYFGGNYVKKEQ